MLDFVDIKSTILKRISTLSEADFDSAALAKLKANEYVSFDLKCQNLDLCTLVTFSQSAPLGYFRERAFDASEYKGQKEILALGENARFEKKTDYNKILEITEKWPDIHVFGAQSFDNEKEKSPEWQVLGECFFFVPKLCFIKNKLETIVRIQMPKKCLKDPREKAKFSFSLEKCLNFKTTSLALPTIFEKNETPGIGTWGNMIKACVTNFEHKKLNKVVLARKNIIYYSEDLNLAPVFSALVENQKQSYIMALVIDDKHSFVSVTPERLFKVENNLIEIDSLAGTRKRSANESEDKLLENDLKSSFKELQEHRFVSASIQEKLESLGINPTIIFKEQVLKLKFVQHLHTKISAPLTSKENFAVLLNTFHPTPAVGGLPKKEAMGLIRKLEPFNRGLYAAPMGYISGHSCEFAVAIRSALLEEDRIHIYGGAGIVLGSDAKSEWDETAVKMDNFLTILSLKES